MDRQNNLYTFILLTTVHTGTLKFKLFKLQFFLFASCWKYYVFFLYSSVDFYRYICYFIKRNIRDLNVKEKTDFSKRIEKLGILIKVENRSF